MRFVAGNASEVRPGGRKLVFPDNGPGIGIFNVAGCFYALKNACPHQGGPLCSGALTGTTTGHFPLNGPPELRWERQGEILRCPWHHWEFEIATGRTVFPSRDRVATYPVFVDEQPRGNEATMRNAETYPVEVDAGLLIVELPDR